MSGVHRRGRGRLRTVPAAVRDELRQTVRKCAAEVVAIQKTLAPVQYGDLKKSITFTMGNESGVPHATLKAGGVTGENNDLAAVISAGNSNVRYAHLVEFGTAPHVIRPKTGDTIGAHGEFGSEVHHPGAAPRPFFLPGWRLARTAVKKQMRKAIRDGADKVVRKG